jgi:hypothetical protein
MMVRSVSVMASAAVLFGTWMAPAAAQLNMTFEGNQSRVCMQTNSGYDANLALLGPSTGFVASFLDKRVIHFNPDGTGSSNLKSIRIGIGQTNPGSTPATESVISCTFTYRANQATKVINTHNGVCTGTVLTGPGAGQVIQTTNIQNEYALLLFGNAIVSQATTPNVETSTNLTTGAVTQQICARTGTSYLKP